MKGIKGHLSFYLVKCETSTHPQVLLGELRQLTDTLAATKEQYKQVSGGVTERSRHLAQLADELEAVKAEMEERGSAMTDGTPLVNVRRSLTRMKQEVTAMNVRIGVVEHTVLQAKLRDKSNLQRDMMGLGGGGGAGQAALSFF